LGRSEAGWSFGELEGDVNCSGWFPSDFVALADSTGSLEVPALSLNATSEVLDDLDTDTDLLVSSTFMVPLPDTPGSMSYFCCSNSMGPSAAIQFKTI
jgi:hypothetical protein